MINQELAPSEKKEVTGYEQTLAGRAYVPEVDIFEDTDALWLWADMPGVKSDSVSVELDDNVLSLQGQVETRDYSGLTPAYTEYNVGNFVRHFTVPRSSALDHDRITARVIDGVVEVKLPKAEKAKPKRIAITS
jgi:HSP20 family molecular chaperone IbpA